MKIGFKGIVRPKMKVLPLFNPHVLYVVIVFMSKDDVKHDVICIRCCTLNAMKLKGD